MSGFLHSITQGLTDMAQSAWHHITHPSASPHDPAPAPAATPKPAETLALAETSGPDEHAQTPPPASFAPAIPSHADSIASHSSSADASLHSASKASTIDSTISSDGRVNLSALYRLLQTETLVKYEDKCRSVAAQIELLHGSMRHVDSFFAEVTNELNAHKEIDLSKGRFPVLLRNLKGLGFDAPSELKMDMEQATAFIKTIEHKRDEIERDMKLKYNKFAESSKDLETLRKVLFDMQTELNKTIEKLSQGIRG